MRITSNKIKDIISFFKQELNGLYDEREIRSLINLVMEEFQELSPIELTMNSDKTVSESMLLKFNFAIKDLKQFKPLQYILGNTRFYDVKVKVGPDVLIPRPETEELVKWVIDEYKHSINLKATKKQASMRLLDIGTGSGCIAITIKKNIPEFTVSATDISENALKIAQHNADINDVGINFIHHDIFTNTIDCFKNKYDIFVSNPPYVRESEKALMHANVLKYEPALALFVSDERPLIYYEAIADLAKLKLKSTGTIYIEINEALAAETSEMFKSKGFSKITIRKDINERDRMMKVKV